jgi:pimeloyl-ACP methyl ester carboxylesterase
VRCLVNFDERGNLASIRVPVLCLAGELDRNAPPAMMARMASKIPGARYVCLPGVGHQPNLEAPRLFDAAVLEFLNPVLQPRTEKLHA